MDKQNMIGPPKPPSKKTSGNPLLAKAKRWAKNLFAKKTLAKKALVEKAKAKKALAQKALAEKMTEDSKATPALPPVPVQAKPVAASQQTAVTPTVTPPAPPRKKMNGAARSRIGGFFAKLSESQPGPFVQFILQIAPIFGYLLYHHYGHSSLDGVFADALTNEQALINLGLLLPWLTQVAVINTCQNNGYPGRRDSLLEDILGILRSLLFYSLPILAVLMGIAVAELDWTFMMATKFTGFMLINIMMSITFVVLSIHKLWRWWFFGNVLYISLLFAVPSSVFVAPIATFFYGLFAIRVGRTLPFKLEIISEWHAGIFGLCLGSILWLDKILWWLAGSELMHSGSIFILVIPGIMLTAVYFSFFAEDLSKRIDGLYETSKDLSVGAYFDLVATIRVYFKELTLSLVSLALVLFLLVIAILEWRDIQYGAFHFAWLTAILCQSLALVFALILNTLSGKDAVVRIAKVYGVAMLMLFIALPEPLVLVAQVILSAILAIAFWLECRNTVTHPVEIAFVQNIHSR